MLMKRMLLIILLWTSASAYAAGPDALDIARQLAGAGALQLALDRVEHIQPGDAAAPRWAEWEMLRLSLLNRLGRQPALLQRVSAMPVDMSPVVLRGILILAARAAVDTDQGTLARAYAARALWQLNPAPAEVKELRLLIIDSQVADRQGDEAFRSMLRYQQDYQPSERDTANRFVAGLLELGMAKEAVNWLAGMDNANPLKLMLRLKAGLVSADAAIVQARTQLAKSSSSGYWQVLEQAAVVQKNRALQIESQETLLHLVPVKSLPQQATQARALWQLYLSTAQDAGNQNQLLVGDDAAWAGFAERQLAKQPYLSRALLAQLAQHGHNSDVRHHAQLQMVLSLQSDRRELAALRLFQHAGSDVTVIDKQARYVLGTIAESRNLQEIALHFWLGLAAPPDVGAENWQLRIAAAAVRAGRLDDAATAINSVIGARKTLSDEIARRCVLLAQDILQAGNSVLAGELLEGMLPWISATQQRSALIALGRIREISHQLPAAADDYLRSALLGADGRAPDALASQARLAAAFSLARAGYKDDARAQFEWLLSHSKDTAQIDIARRELKKL